MHHIVITYILLLTTDYFLKGHALKNCPCTLVQQICSFPEENQLEILLSSAIN